MNKFLYLSFLISNIAIAQESEGGDSFSFFADVLGRKGLLVAVGLMFFLYSYKNSIKLFDWIEDQTFGTRDFILQKCELLHVEIEPRNVTYILLFLSFGLGVLVFGGFALAGKIGTGAVMALIVSLIGWKAPKPIMNALVERRIKKYQDQMVDALNLLSNGLRAGLSVPQSLSLVVDELPAPVSQEFNQILQQTKIGVPLEEAFENLVKRVPTQDNEMFVSSVNILRETGGNLAEVFDTITGVIRERVRLAQKIDTYVAQGKFQGYTIFAMPFVMMAIFTVSDPASMDQLYNTVIGNIVLGLAIGMSFLGLYFILKIVKIKV